SKYITVNSEGNLSLTSKSSSDKDSQLFGFTKLGNYRTQIISKATRSPLLNETNGWALRQVFSTNNPDQPIQGLIRTKVYGNSATITEQGYILTSSLIKEDYNRKLDFFDNKYTWAYEIATFNIEVNEGERITLTSPSSETIESGQSFTVTYQVESGFVPTVNINGIAHSVGTLNNGIYTLVLENITSDTSINISSEAAAYTVTVNVSDGISVQSPTLDPNKQYVAGTNSVIQFSLDEGYNNLQITTNGKATASDPEPTGNNNYVINLSNIQDGAEISINCLVISYNVNLTTDGVNVVGSPAEEANYFDEYTFSFTLEAGYNHPQVFVNQKYVKATEEEGTYQVSLSNVRENLIIAVKAFQLPQNTVPVLADTYIDGRTAAINYSASEDLRAQASTSTYNRISYLEFDATAIDISQYDKVYLQLVYKSRQSGKNADPIFQLRTVPSSVGELYQLNYNNSGEGSGVSRNGDPIGNPLTFDRTSAIETVVKFDITSYVLNNSASKLRLQLTGSSDNDAGFFNFYSSEGALNRNDLSLMPVLIFEAASNEWNGNIDNDWSNINNWNIPFLPSTDTEVKIPSGKANYPLLSANTTLKELIMEEEAEIKLADGVSLTIDGIVTIEKNVTQYIWYPIGFPFEARAYYMPYTPEEELIPFVEGVGGDFWLKDYNGTDGIFAYTAHPLAAGKGYIAQFPAMFNNETITYTSVNGPHIFSKTGLTVTENYQFLANPTLEEIDLPEMEGTYYYIYNPASSAFERKTSGTLKPFEAVIAVANPAELRSIIDLGEGYTGIDPKVITNTEYGPIKEVRYYNLQGIEIPEPTYLEACIVKTVYESGKQITQKFIIIKNR
ncbi:MAG: DNRLRE domain-containing protein, partial [Bacteroidales bacterium]|nr:DNRLRE domain-containing protein [Bacteroidales bacterium]